MRARNVAIALILGACAGGQESERRAAEPARIRSLAAAPGRSHHAIWGEKVVLESVPLDQDFPSAYAAKLVPLLGDKRIDVAAQAAFDIGATGVEQAADLIERHLPEHAPPDVVAAAATGLAYCKSESTERVLVGLALRPSNPPEAISALFSHYRGRGPDRPAPAKLPDSRLLLFAFDRAAASRAAFGHLGRAIKDPTIIDTLTELTHDRSWEVRRAAALALADGPPKSPRPADDGQACIGVLAARISEFEGDDAHVVAAACRALASYDDPKVPKILVIASDHSDFNVRVAALEGLGKRKAKEAVETMQRIARTDPSTSCRYTASVQLADIDLAAARSLVADLLAQRSEYVRSAAAEILGKAEDAEASKQLAEIARNDSHIRVRETAVGALEGKKDDLAKETVRWALADKDVGMVSTACAVAAKNKYADLVPVLSEVPARFPGCLGADAREAAVSALADLGLAQDSTVFTDHLRDPNPAVRAAAEKAVAPKVDKAPTPMPTRGADLTGELLPGGAPVIDENTRLVVETDQGTMKIRLYPREAPIHCAHVVSLAMTGFYDNLTWHRVVPDFVIQGGCPRGDGSGNAGVTLPLESTRVPFERGTLGMPRSNHPDTGGCQLFICHSRAPHLDVQYTAFGKVVEGLDVIDRIDVDSKILRVFVEGAR